MKDVRSNTGFIHQNELQILGQLFNIELVVRRSLVQREAYTETLLIFSSSVNTFLDLLEGPTVGPFNVG